MLIIAKRYFLQLGLFFQVSKAVLGAETLIGRPVLQKFVHMLGVNQEPLGLEYRPLVPPEPKKLKSFFDIIGGALDLAGAVRILDAQNEFAAVLAGEKKIKKRGAQSADMQKSGWRWRKPDSD